MARAKAFCDMPAGFRNSSSKISPGCGTGNEFSASGSSRRLGNLNFNSGNTSKADTVRPAAAIRA
jgi:hypothetical protein